MGWRLLLMSCIAVLVRTSVTVNVCTEASCIVSPRSVCRANCHEGVLKNKLPDGPLRNLPGTVRNLTLLVDNTARGLNPTVVIEWKPPKDVHVSVYEVHLSTWDNALLPTASTQLPHVYTANTSDTSQVDKVVLRVTSSTFRGLHDITVYVNTWAGNRTACNLRQAKSTFYTMASLKVSTKRWRYHETLSPQAKGGVSISFLPLPSATHHEVQLCEQNSGVNNQGQARKWRCKTRIIPAVQNTTTFPFKRNCTSYRLTIIPYPSSHGEMKRDYLFRPECSHCYRALVLERFTSRQPSPQSSDLENYEVNVTINVQTIILLTTASLAGLGIGIVFIVLKLRLKRRPQYQDLNRRGYCHAPCNAPSSVKTETTQHKQRDFWQELHSSNRKRICLVDRQRSKCHIKVVQAFCSCLKMHFRCYVLPLDWSDDIEHQLQHADAIIVVYSDAFATTLHSGDSDAFATTLHSGAFNERQSPVESSQRPSSHDVIVMCDFINDNFTDKRLFVRFSYTNRQEVPSEDSNVVFDIPEELYDLVCNVHDLEMTRTRPVWNVTSDDPVVGHLTSSIRTAQTCHEMSERYGRWGHRDGETCRCGELSMLLPSESPARYIDDKDDDDDADDDDFYPPSLPSEFDHLPSISEELLNIDKLYEQNTVS